MGQRGDGHRGRLTADRMRRDPEQPREAAREHTLEWPGRATWVCQANRALVAPRWL